MSDADAIDSAYYGDGRFDKPCLACATKDAEIARLRGLIHKAQAILTDYLVPTGTAERAIEKLLALLDGPESRFALSSYPQSDGWISVEERVKNAIVGVLETWDELPGLASKLEIAILRVLRPLPEPPEVK